MAGGQEGLPPFLPQGISQSLPSLGTHPRGPQLRGSTQPFPCLHVAPKCPLPPSSVLLAGATWLWYVLMLMVLLPLAQTPHPSSCLPSCWGLQTCSWAADLQGCSPLRMSCSRANVSCVPELHQIKNPTASSAWCQPKSQENSEREQASGLLVHPMCF